MGDISISIGPMALCGPQYAPDDATQQQWRTHGWHGMYYPSNLFICKFEDINFTARLSEEELPADQTIFVPAIGEVEALPAMVFDAECENQLIIQRVCIESGLVRSTEKRGALRIRMPVMMCPTYAGFYCPSGALRLVQYDGVSFVFARAPGGKYMVPAIDTLLFCLGCKRFFQTRGTCFRSVVEMCSGSGFVAKYVGHQLDGPAQIRLIDIDPSAMEFVQSDSCGLKSAAGVDWQFELGDAARMLEPGQLDEVDLLVCNPPYCPTRHECETDQVDPVLFNFWEVRLPLRLGERRMLVWCRGQTSFRDS